MSTIKRPQRIQRNRRGRSKNVNPLRLTLVPSIIDFVTPNITLTFPVPVVLTGLPQWLTNTGKLPDSATRPTPNTVVMHYDTPGSVTTVTVPENDPAIRSASGGYAAAGTFPAA
jgi:hypothetical protein